MIILGIAYTEQATRPRGGSVVRIICTLHFLVVFFRHLVSGHISQQPAMRSFNVSDFVCYKYHWQDLKSDDRLRVEDRVTTYNAAPSKKSILRYFAKYPKILCQVSLLSFFAIKALWFYGKKYIKQIRLQSSIIFELQPCQLLAKIFYFLKYALK